MFRLSVRPKIIIKNFVVFVLVSFQDSLGMRLCTYGSNSSLVPRLPGPGIQRRGEPCIFSPLSTIKARKVVQKVSVHTLHVHSCECSVIHSSQVFIYTQASLHVLIWWVFFTNKFGSLLPLNLVTLLRQLVVITVKRQLLEGSVPGIHNSKQSNKQLTTQI